MASKKVHFIVTLTANQFSTALHALYRRKDFLAAAAREIGPFSETYEKSTLRAVLSENDSTIAAVRKGEEPQCDCHSNSSSECKVDWHGHCEPCNDTGILLMNEDGSNLDVQKCDNCNRYDEDGEAVEALNKLLYGCPR